VCICTNFEFGATKKQFLARGNFYFLQIRVSPSEIFEFVAVSDRSIDTVKI
jgi:hypothetical protein